LNPGFLSLWTIWDQGICAIFVAGFKYGMSRNSTEIRDKLRHLVQECTTVGSMPLWEIMKAGEFQDCCLVQRMLASLQPITLYSSAAASKLCSCQFLSSISLIMNLSAPWHAHMFLVSWRWSE
jgi:hypothetical protein